MSLFNNLRNLNSAKFTLKADELDKKLDEAWIEAKGDMTRFFELIKPLQEEQTQILNAFFGDVVVKNLKKGG